VPDFSHASRSFMDALTDSDRIALQAAGHRRSWAAGEAIIRAGDRADSTLVLLEGLVKIHRLAADGADVVLNLSGPGDLLGEVSAVGQDRRSASATALTPVDAIVLAAAELRGFLAAHPQSAIALLDLTLGRLHVADARRMEFATSESLGRVTSRLIELAARFGTPRADGAIEVALPMTQEDLASWSASSRESTARALRTLRQLGLIETHRLRLTVLDLESLRGHAARL
jgi:CRP-like cAMP-binding protein